MQFRRKLRDRLSYLISIKIRWACFCCPGVRPRMPEMKKRADRRERQSLEIEASQASLRKSIAETERLVDESDEMLRRHRRECDEDELSAPRR